MQVFAKGKRRFHSFTEFYMIHVKHPEVKIWSYGTLKFDFFFNTPVSYFLKCVHTKFCEIPSIILEKSVYFRESYSAFSCVFLLTTHALHLTCFSRTILVPRAHDPSGLWLGSRALARSDFLSMRRVFVSHSQPIRFVRFEGKSVNRGLPNQSSRSQPQARRIVGSGNENG